MKILFDIGHPAHVHIFRNLAKELEKQGHTILFTCREKECTIELLKNFDLPYKSFGHPFKKGIGKIWGLFVFNTKMLKILLRFKPDITLGHSSMYAAQMSWLLGIPHISMEDTGNMEQVRLYKPFTKAILVPESFNKNLGGRQIAYKGNHELAYLHPSRFKLDPSILKDLQIKPGEPYVILRFVAWNASHDSGHGGIRLKNKLKAIKLFSEHARIFISSEAELPSELEKYRLKTKPAQLHDVIAYASLLFGESATMASEAAILGVPGIFINNTSICYTREEEDNYGLVFNFTESEEDQVKAIEKGLEIITTVGIKEEWAIRRQKMLNDKIDVTAFLVWFVENWPESFKVMKEKGEWEERFRSLGTKGLRD
ncbi:MAG: DUF354 domain-containing protein [Bacteroidales bacterium]|nr:DUF354 domain-containing protein [Bacteroidales bacterium]